MPLLAILPRESGAFFRPTQDCGSLGLCTCSLSLPICLGREDTSLVAGARYQVLQRASEARFSAIPAFASTLGVSSKSLRLAIRSRVCARAFRGRGPPGLLVSPQASPFDLPTQARSRFAMTSEYARISGSSGTELSPDPMLLGCAQGVGAKWVQNRGFRT
jgi:hypothetical protein